ncbi:MAG: metal-dependent transcriptional regulator [Methanomicrobia archaeon]|nr:metal-dependent transcriptional regulator [Methanomicrobia archaeon]
MVSENTEEYLEAIWVLREKESQKIRIIDLADYLNIKPPSVLEKLKKLEEENLITYNKNEGIRFTEKGEKGGKKVIRAHRILESLFTYLEIGEGDMEKLSCACEHISEETVNKICTFLNHPKTCPHGNKIPGGECCKSCSP